jgi:isopentenyl diphosphate isomerase/L-lactate dehydrogenase-like FMN-dependent dehydrogenase
VSVPDPINIADYERLAEESLEPGAHGYFAGGAGDERTLRDNVEAFRRWRLVPRVLVDVSEVSTATTVLGTQISMPIVVAPVAFQRMANEAGEAGMARATTAAGTVMCLSTLATSRPSEVAAAAPDGHRWMQLYSFKDHAVTDALVAEAVESGFEAIVLTVDAPWIGPRERDLRTGFEIPPDVTVPAMADAIGSEGPVSVRDALGLVDPSLDWDDLARLVESYDVPVLIKGVIASDDAERAAECGVAGVIVSNHGGRQLDSVLATIDAVGDVADAVGDRVEVFLDGGVRRGTHVVTALARGARAVLIGRPALWGLAARGEDGARHVLEILRTETALALALCGCPAPADVADKHVTRVGQGLP